MPWVLASAAVSGLVAVCFGAWSAHGAGSVVGPERVEWIKTAVQYQFWHSLALLGTGVLMQLKPGRFLPLAAGAFGAGIVLFSGSLYLLAFSGAAIFAYGVPVGGICFMAGWLFLAVYALMIDRR